MEDDEAPAFVRLRPFEGYYRARPSQMRQIGPTAARAGTRCEYFGTIGGLHMDGKQGLGSMAEDPFEKVPGPDAEIRARLGSRSSSKGGCESTLEAARTMIERGFSVAPLEPGKTSPIVLNGRTIAVRNAEDIDRLIQPEMNLGIWLQDIQKGVAGGSRTYWHMSVIHIEPELGRTTLKELRGLGMTLSATAPRYISPRKALNILYIVPASVNLSNRRDFMPGISFKRNGYVTIPPSRLMNSALEDTGQYAWLTEIPSITSIPIMPAWLLDCVKKACNPKRISARAAGQMRLDI